MHEATETDTPAPTFALGLLRNIRRGPEVDEYLRRIDDTLRPFGGRFRVHGATAEVVEGSWPSALVVIEFPTRERARNWYASPAYQAILPLRTRNADTDVIFIDTVDDAHRSADLVGR